MCGFANAFNGIIIQFSGSRLFGSPFPLKASANPHIRKSAHSFFNVILSRNPHWFDDDYGAFRIVKPVRMNLYQLSVAELEELLVEETKKLTVAIRDNDAQSQRKELRQRIQDIHRLLELKQEQGAGKE
jgi:hypothetical protein